MPKLVTDKMLGTFSVEAAPEEVGAALKERYEGLLDRVSLYTPFEPGKKERFWRTTIATINEGG